MKQIETIKAKPVSKLDWIALVVVALLIVALLLTILLPRPVGNTVEVYSDGKLIASYDLHAEYIRVQKMQGITLFVGQGKATIKEGTLSTIGEPRTISRKGESIVLAEQALTVRVV